jgi:uncharacterized protein with PQ loop repeat
VKQSRLRSSPAPANAASFPSAHLRPGENVITVLAFVTAGWALVMALSPVLQIRRIRRQQSSRDVSLGYWVVLIIGFALWLSYGVAVGDPVLVVPNAFALVVGCITVAVAFHHRPRGSGDTSAAPSRLPGQPGLASAQHLDSRSKSEER